MRDHYDQEVVPFTRRSFVAFVVMIVLLTAPLWLPKVWHSIHREQSGGQTQARPTGAGAR